MSRTYVRATVQQPLKPQLSELLPSTVDQKVLSSVPRCEALSKVIEDFQAGASRQDIGRIRMARAQAGAMGRWFSCEFEAKRQRLCEKNHQIIFQVLFGGSY